MNPVFWLIILLIGACLWIALSGGFRILGKVIKFTKNEISAEINKEDSDNEEK